MSDIHKKLEDLDENFFLRSKYHVIFGLAIIAVVAFGIYEASVLIGNIQH